MTPPIDDPDALRAILRQTDALLLDFDGPVCSVFAGFPASIVAEQLRDVLADGGYVDLPDDVSTTDDPFDVLFYAAKLGQEEVRYVELAFRAHEVEAIATAEPTPHAHELIEHWHSTGRSLAIVSNNSANAVQAYLDLHELRSRISTIAARSNADVSRLKPNSAFVVEAAATLAAPLDRCTFVGDSTTDIQAARVAGTRSIGYVNKPGKDVSLAVCEPEAITTSMDLQRYL